MEVVAGRHAGQSQGGCHHVGKCRSTSRVRGEGTDDTRSHHLPGAQFWIGSSRNWSVFLAEALARDATRSLWFVIHAADC